MRAFKYHFSLSIKTSTSLSSPKISLSKSVTSATATHASTSVGLGVGIASSANVAPILASNFTNEPEALAAMIKNPLLTPLLAASLNNPLYAMQLAQLQAAQLLSHTHQQFARKSSESGECEEVLSNLRKRKATEEGTVTREGLNLSNMSQKSESPLDLSAVGMPSLSPMKIPKIDSAGGMATWAAAAGAFPFISPFLAAGSAADATRFPAANSPPTMTNPPATSLQEMLSTKRTTNPLDQMSEIAKTGPTSKASSAGQRHSAWQSQWINRGPENTKDIFKCVWCKESFVTLQALTSHMKETKHFGPNIPASSTSEPPINLGMAGQLQMAPTPPHPQLSSMLPSPPKQVQISPPLPPPVPKQNRSPSLSSASVVATESPQKRDILKEQLPLPRKLVRGQDVWLGKGEQQTRDILKCMWCGESFRSLDLMTKHMQETKHYTKVISQEQLVSWKSGDGPSMSTAPSSGATIAASGHNESSSNHVSSVLTCKVCNVPFTTLKDLSEHIVKNNHYKDGQVQGQELQTSSSPPIVGRPQTSSLSQQEATLASSATEPLLTAVGQTNPQPKEKRKKSLPVRKLLELERAQHEVSGQLKHAEDAVATGKISCEKCGERIEMQLFVDHIRQCVGPLPHQRLTIPVDSPSKRGTLPDHQQNLQKEPPSIAAISSAASASEEPKSILGSLEKMVQNNFGNKKKAETNLSILQRLGIDEGVDYSKPLVDPMAMFQPQTSAAAAAAVALSFLPTAAAAATAAQFAAPEGTNSKTRSNSECSSPDKYKTEVASTCNLTPVAETQLPGTAMSPSGEKIIEKSPSPEQKNKCLRIEGTRNDTSNDGGSGSEKDCTPTPLRSTSTSPVANSSPSSPGLNITLSKSTNGDEEIEAKDGKCDDDMGQSTADRKNIKKKSHPLAALQMLCDKTEKTKKGLSKAQHPENLSSSAPTADPGSILAFSWACNQAVVNDSLFKCPFCDTPFISKGAYRHHLSKMHFVKDGTSPDPKMMFGKTATEADNSKCPTPTGNGSESTSGSDKEENAQSKFQKYSKLAKQLSCTGQP